jgi:hypothetical protein
MRRNRSMAPGFGVVAVGVVLAGELAVGLLDISQGGV